MNRSIFSGIVSQLLLPQEIVKGVTLCLVQIVNDVSVVHLYCDQCHDDLTNNRWNLSSHNCCQFFELVDDHIQMSLNSLAGICIFFYCLFSVQSPNDLGGNSDDLTRLCHDPVSFFLVFSIHPLIETHANDPSHRIVHFLLQMAEPNLNTVLRLHHCLEHHTLLFRTEHTLDQICLR